MTKLRKIRAGQYQTLDGRFNVEHDENHENECNCIICQQSYHEAAGCPNGGFASEYGWILWDNEGQDYALGTGPLHFKTKREAVEFLTREGVTQ